MEAQVKARKIGGSIAIFIPREIVEKERIKIDDTLKIQVMKVGDLSFMWGKGKDIKKPTKQIMKEIDEGEYE